MIRSTKLAAQELEAKLAEAVEVLGGVQARMQGGEPVIAVADVCTLVGQWLKDARELGRLAASTEAMLVAHATGAGALRAAAADPALHRAHLLRLWDASVGAPGYRKAGWNELDQALTRLEAAALLAWSAAAGVTAATPAEASVDVPIVTAPDGGPTQEVKS